MRTYLGQLDRWRSQGYVLVHRELDFRPAGVSKW